VLTLRTICGDSLLNVGMSPVDTRNSEETMEWMGKTKEIEETMEWMGKTKEIEEQEYHKQY
jgi:hypothetical protein